jgi:hypothetical protein
MDSDRVESDRMSTDKRRKSGETPRDQLHLPPQGTYLQSVKERDGEWR